MSHTWEMLNSGTRLKYSRRVLSSPTMDTFPRTLTRLLLLASHAVFATAYIVNPPASAAPSTIQDCTNWYIPVTGDTCQSIAYAYGLTPDQFVAYVRFRFAMLALKRTNWL